jgi:hypothetical protein
MMSRIDSQTLNGVFLLVGFTSLVIACIWIGGGYSPEESK